MQFVERKIELLMELYSPFYKFHKGQRKQSWDNCLFSQNADVFENEKSLQGKLYFLTELTDALGSLFRLELSLFIALPPPKQPGIEYHMFTGSLFVTTSRFPTTQGFSHIEAPRCNSPWHYMTNCFPNVLPRCLFRFVTEPINSLSMVGSDSALLLDDHSWQLIMAQKFCFPHCSVFWQGWMSQ